MSDDEPSDKERMGKAWSKNNNRINMVRRIKETIETLGVENVDEDVLVDVFDSIEEQMLEEKKMMQEIMDKLEKVQDEESLETMKKLEEMEERVKRLREQLEEAKKDRE